MRHLQLRSTCRSWRSSFKTPLVCLAKPVGCQGVKKSCYSKHSLLWLFWMNLGDKVVFVRFCLGWIMNSSACNIVSFLSFSMFHSVSIHSRPNFVHFPSAFIQLFPAVWALIYLHITWFLNHSQALCWSVWSKWAVSLWPKKRGCKAQLLGGGVCWCWSQFLFIPVKVEGQGATIRVSQPNYPSTA